MPKITKPESNHLIDYFETKDGVKQEPPTSKELFKADSKDVDIKTDLQLREIMLLNVGYWNNDYLERHGLKPIYRSFLDKHLRFKISLDRKSRSEFVDINRSKTDEKEIISTMSNIKNITEAKK